MFQSQVLLKITNEELYEIQEKLIVDQEKDLILNHQFTFIIKKLHL